MAQVSSWAGRWSSNGCDASPIRYQPSYDLTTSIWEFPLHFDTLRFSILPQSDLLCPIHLDRSYWTRMLLWVVSAEDTGVQVVYRPWKRRVQRWTSLLCVFETKRNTDRGWRLYSRMWGGDLQYRSLWLRICCVFRGTSDISNLSSILPVGPRSSISIGSIEAGSRFFPDCWTWIYAVEKRRTVRIITARSGRSGHNTRRLFCCSFKGCWYCPIILVWRYNVSPTIGLLYGPFI